MPDPYEQHRDAIAFGYDVDGRLKKLVPIFGLGCRSRLQWQTENGQACEAPLAIKDAWVRLQSWIGFNGGAQADPAG